MMEVPNVLLAFLGGGGIAPVVLRDIYGIREGSWCNVALQEITRPSGALGMVQVLEMRLDRYSLVTKGCGVYG